MRFLRPGNRFNFMTYGMPGGERATQKLTPNIISELQFFFGGAFFISGRRYRECILRVKQFHIYIRFAKIKLLLQCVGVKMKAFEVTMIFMLV